MATSKITFLNSKSSKSSFFNWLTLMYHCTSFLHILTASQSSSSSSFCTFHCLEMWSPCSGIVHTEADGSCRQVQGFIDPVKATYGHGVTAFVEDSLAATVTYGRCTLSLATRMNILKKQNCQRLSSLRHTVSCFQNCTWHFLAKSLHLKQLIIHFWPTPEV